MVRAIAVRYRFLAGHNFLPRRALLSAADESGRLHWDAAGQCWMGCPMILEALSVTLSIDTSELQRDFEVTGFMAPFCAVIRKSDLRKGSVSFQHSPRFYFDFKPVQ